VALRYLRFECFMTRSGDRDGAKRAEMREIARFFKPAPLFNDSSIWLIAEPESTVISALKLALPLLGTAVVNVNHAGTRGVINGTESRSRGESLARVIGAFSSLECVLLDILTSSRELAVYRARDYVPGLSRSARRVKPATGCAGC